MALYIKMKAPIVITDPETKEVIVVEPKVQQYCAEAQAQGYSARPEMVGKLLLLPSHQWGAQFSDTEIAIASRIQCESKS